MKFEDALREMRMGAKITHKYLGEDVYLMGCYRGFPSFYDDNGNLVEETFEQKKERGMSIIKMKGEYAHEDMGMGIIDDMVHPGTLIIKEKYLQPPCKHGNFPMLNLLLIMSDAWEFV